MPETKACLEVSQRNFLCRTPCLSYLQSVREISVRQSSESIMDESTTRMFITILEYSLPDWILLFAHVCPTDTILLRALSCGGNCFTLCGNVLDFTVNRANNFILHRPSPQWHVPSQIDVLVTVYYPFGSTKVSLLLCTEQWIRSPMITKRFDMCRNSKRWATSRLVALNAQPSLISYMTNVYHCKQLVRFCFIKMRRQHIYIDVWRFSGRLGIGLGRLGDRWCRRQFLYLSQIQISLYKRVAIQKDVVGWERICYSTVQLFSIEVTGKASWQIWLDGSDCKTWSVKIKIKLKTFRICLWKRKCFYIV